MATDFKYASQSDLEMYYPAYSQFDTKRQILGWEAHTVDNKWQARNSGLVTQLFENGDDLGPAQSSIGAVSSDDLWHYASDIDTVFYYNDGYTSTTILDVLFEGGIDNATYFDQMLVNASMELNNMLDARFPTPIPKYSQYDQNTAYSSSSTEYDAIIIKATCYICAANLLRTSNKQDEADYYGNLVSNPDNTGMIDRLNSGQYKLTSEVDTKDSKGKVRTITKSGSMDIVETGGAYLGEPFDLLRITCTTTGAYGAAKVKVEYYGNDKLLGQEETDITVTGTLQEIHSGWYCRFQGASMTQNDQWEVEVYSRTRKVSNSQIGSVVMTRTGRGL